LTDPAPARVRQCVIIQGALSRGEVMTQSGICCANAAYYAGINILAESSKAD